VHHKCDKVERVETQAQELVLPPVSKTLKEEITRILAGVANGTIPVWEGEALTWLAVRRELLKDYPTG
jgi:hypothetical protein